MQPPLYVIRGKFRQQHVYNTTTPLCLYHFTHTECCLLFLRYRDAEATHINSTQQRATHAAFIVSHFVTIESSQFQARFLEVHRPVAEKIKQVSDSLLKTCRDWFSAGFQQIRPNGIWA